MGYGIKTMIDGWRLKRVLAIFACSLLATLSVSAAQAQDILDEQLRVEVEALKQAAATPTTCTITHNAVACCGAGRMLLR